jgi:hypothetical protein
MYLNKPVTNGRITKEITISKYILL